MLCGHIYVYYEMNVFFDVAVNAYLNLNFDEISKQTKDVFCNMQPFVCV